MYHGVKIPNNHVVVNLWHGMPLKNIGYLDGKKVIPQSSLAIATSKVYQEIISQSFGLNTNNVLITGQPRCDLMFDKIDLKQIFELEDTIEKVILWLPTYRHSIIGDIRVDSNYGYNLPVLSDKDLIVLNNYLASKDYYLIIKLHLMDILNEIEFNKYSNIKIVKNTEFISYDVPLYQILGNIDLLLTDFSSVYIDFLLTLKPIGFIFDDLEEYSSGRGFVFENYKEYMPSVQIINLSSLLSFIDEVFINDLFHSDRLKLLDLLHDKKKNFSQNLFNILNNNLKFLE